MDKVIKLDIEKDIVRKVGGIVHGDGNIFFTNQELFLEAARAILKAYSEVEVDQTSLRKEFEKWYSPTYWVYDPVWTPERNCYADLPTHMAWRGWLAGRLTIGIV